MKTCNATISDPTKINFNHEAYQVMQEKLKAREP